MVGTAMHRFGHDPCLGWGRPCSARGRASCPVRLPCMVGPALHGGRVKRGVTDVFWQGLSSHLTCALMIGRVGTLHIGVPLCVVQALWRAHSRISLPEHR